MNHYWFLGSTNIQRKSGQFKPTAFKEDIGTSYLAQFQKRGVTNLKNHSTKNDKNLQNLRQSRTVVLYDHFYDRSVNFLC